MNVGIKEQCFRALEADLRRELAEATAASREAAAYATDEESRADSKWDTQGLEASYLAAGQASHARAIVESLQLVERYRKELLASAAEVTLGAIATIEVNGFRDAYYITPTHGGIVLRSEGNTVTTLTFQTPLGGVLRGKRVGAEIRLPSGVIGQLVAVS